MDRIKALDGFRAIAVLTVIIGHAGLKNYVPGSFGVTMFFFISGYLITTLLVKEWRATGKTDLPAFYFRRSIRIIPIMLIAIALAIVLDLVGLGPSMYFPSLWQDLLFLTNYAPQTSRIPIPLWSLDVEEHFYLIFPIAFIISYQVNQKSTIFIIVVGIILALLIRIMTYGTDDQAHIYFWTHTRVDSILYGCLLAVFNNPILKDKAWIGVNRAYFMCGCALLVFAILYKDPFFRETWRYSIQGMGLFLVFNFVLRTEGLVNNLLSIAPLKVVADYSYALYLTHYPLLVAADMAMPDAPHAFRGAAAIGATFVLAHALRHLVELPLLEWRKGVQKRLQMPAAMMPKGLE